MKNNVTLFMEDQVYEVQWVYASLSNGRISVTGKTSEKMGESYGLCYELEREDTKKLEEYLGVEEAGLLAEVKRCFSGVNADTDFRDFCRALGLGCRCFVA